MTPEEVKQAVRSALQEDRSEFWISHPDHYTDHQWVRNTRGMLDNARKVGIFTTISTLVGVILLLLWAGIKDGLR